MNLSAFCNLPIASVWLRQVHSAPESERESVYERPITVKTSILR